MFLTGCEKLEVTQKLKDLASEKNETKPETVDQTEYSTPPPPIELTQEPPPAPEVTPLAPVSSEIPQPILPSKPEPAKFSDELLAAVKNWSKVPKSVFPAKPVLANIDINLVAKTSSGQVIGNSLTPAGAELQVLGMSGSTLIVANANNTRLRGEVDIDQTDFKQLLAYRFELNKRKKEELHRIKEEQEKVYSEKKTSSQNPSNSPAINEIPDPLDFGHGRFCICKDCREKRLSKTGSLKTGFGLEP